MTPTPDEVAMLEQAAGPGERVAVAEWTRPDRAPAPLTPEPCVFIPKHEPWSCATHAGGYRVSLADAVCRAAQAEAAGPLTNAQLEEFDRFAEGRRGKGVSLGLLWALRLRATLDAERDAAGRLREACKPFATDTAGHWWNDERNRDECWECEHAYPGHEATCSYAILRAALDAEPGHPKPLIDYRAEAERSIAERRHMNDLP